MAEAVALGASIIAIYQIADRLIGLCKFYIETVKDAPSDLRKILVELSALKTIFQDLEFLKRCDSKLSAVLESMAGSNGSIGACRQAVADMEKLFPQDSVHTHGSADRASKKKKVAYMVTLTELAWPLKASKAMKLLQDISMHKTTITLALTANSLHDIKDIKSRAIEIHDILTEAQRHEVFKWLQVTDPSPLHYRAHEQYEPKTGGWMLRSPEWNKWIECKNRSLWIHGIPGAGKTVLASYLIEELNSHYKTWSEKRCTHIYYYCHFGHNQDEAAPFLRWVINRLCRTTNTVPSRVYDMFKHGGTPHLVDLMDALDMMLSASFDTVYIVIDAIDESTPRADLLKLLRDLATDPRFEKIQLLTTSREYLDIERVMEEVSVGVSMHNSLVDEDIRIYVQSQLHTLPNFKRWPPNLLAEAEQALMSKAKGMFRWAVCQIDVLRRLKPTSRSISNALANLPRTLDETYERIFLGIPDDDRLFVHHALKWIYYYNDGRRIFHGGIPSSILLHAIERSTSHLSNGQQDFLYDEEALRELCGCLMMFTSDRLFFHTMEAVSTVTFAHYTVLEFLQSTRIFNSPVAFFGIEKASTAVDFTRVTLMEALDADSNILGGKQYYDNNGVSAIADVVAEGFNSYCTASVMISINSWEPHLNDQDDLVTLVFDIMNPLKPHFESLCNSLEIMEESLLILTDNNVPIVGQFWNTFWVVPPANINSAILLGLLGVDTAELLLPKLMKKVNIEALFEEEVFLVTKCYDHVNNFGRRWYHIKGSIVDAIAQLFMHAERSHILLCSLLDSGARHLNASTTLLSYIGSHHPQCENHDDCGETCPLIRLLQLGARPDVPGYRVKPLQIAVVSWDFKGVEILLQAGADPNDCGNENGIAWNNVDFLGQFNHLGGCSPLFICQEIECIDAENSINPRAKANCNRIEELLVAARARSFKEDWACEVITEEEEVESVPRRAAKMMQVMGRLRSGVSGKP